MKRNVTLCTKTIINTNYFYIFYRLLGASMLLVFSWFVLFIFILQLALDTTHLRAVERTAHKTCKNLNSANGAQCGHIQKSIYNATDHPQICNQQKWTIYYVLNLLRLEILMMGKPTWESTLDSTWFGSAQLELNC